MCYDRYFEEIKKEKKKVAKPEAVKVAATPKVNKQSLKVQGAFRKTRVEARRPVSVI